MEVAYAVVVGRGGAVVEACRIHAERGEYVKLRVRPLETYDQGSGNCLDLRGQPVRRVLRGRRHDQPRQEVRAD